MLGMVHDNAIPDQVHVFLSNVISDWNGQAGFESGRLNHYLAGVINLRIVLFALFCLLSVNISANDAIKRGITSGLYRLAPELEITGISRTPVDGLYQVIVGPDVIYMTADGNFVLKGDLIDINQRRNLTESVRAVNRAALLGGIRDEDYIEFRGNESRHTLYVFTDIDCGYCRKLHQDMPELNARGISVRYLAYPRAGSGSGSAIEMAYVWCAKDRQVALTRAKSNRRIDAVKCDNPVAEQYALGKQIGVRGTPAIYTETGRVIPGYMPPDRLLRQISH